MAAESQVGALAQCCVRWFVHCLKLLCYAFRLSVVLSVQVDHTWVESSDGSKKKCGHGFIASFSYTDGEQYFLSCSTFCLVGVLAGQETHIAKSFGKVHVGSCAQPMTNAFLAKEGLE